jgi:small subunit ribosomal protein S6
VWLHAYELVFIVRPTVDEERMKTVVERVSTYITDRGGTVEKVDPWGRRRMAYPIEDHLDGQYVLTQFKADPAITGDLEASLRISEDVIRHLLIRTDQ